MQFKDYYKVLDVARDASADDIKKAFRKLARKYHPDVSKEADAQDRMRDVNEANAVLSDPEKRAAYDALGSQPQSPPSLIFSPSFFSQRAMVPACIVGEREGNGTF